MNTIILIIIYILGFIILVAASGHKSSSRSSSTRSHRVNGQFTRRIPVKEWGEVVTYIEL